LRRNAIKNEQTKGLLKEGFCKLRDQMKSISMQEGSRKDVVSKEIEDRFMVISADLTTVQKSVEEIRQQVAEDAERLRRRNNIVIYNVSQSKATSNADKLKEDKDSCQELMKSVLRV
jgi:hypothetical protein